MNQNSSSQGRRHRRAASCYDFDFNNLGATKTEETEGMQPAQATTFQQTDISESEKESFDVFQYFRMPKHESVNEKSVFVESIEGDQEVRQKKGLGLKFATNTGPRVLIEKKSNGVSSSLSRDDSELNDKLVEGFESPKSGQSKEKIQRIQVKYVTDLQRIDEDAHEISLANSRNSLVLKNSAQKTLARIVRASGSGRKYITDNIVHDNLILEEFDIFRGDLEDKENIKKDNNRGSPGKKLIGSNYKKTPVWANDPILLIKQTSAWDNSMPAIAEISQPSSTRAAIKDTKINSSSSRTGSKTGEDPPQKESFSRQGNHISSHEENARSFLQNSTLPTSLSKSFFLAKAFQCSTKSIMNGSQLCANQSSSSNSQQLIEKGNKLISRAKNDLGSRNCLKTTLQRLYNERGKKDGSVSLTSTNPAQPSRPVPVRHSVLQKECKDSTHMPKKEGRPKSRPSRGSDVSDSKSLLKSGQRKNVSETLGDQNLQEMINQKFHPKKRSASISAQPCKMTLTKSQSTTKNFGLGTYTQGRLSDLQMEIPGDQVLITFPEMQSLVKQQSMILTQLRVRLSAVENENKIITSRYSRLKQENHRLQLEVTSLVALGLGNSNSLKSLTSRVENFANMR